MSDPTQTWFVYAGVPIEPDHAAQLVSEFRAKHRMQGNELFFNMTLPGRRTLVAEFIRLLPPELRVSVCHKGMSLACKFYEYVYEPVLQNFSTFYYEIDFHRFISETIFAFKMARDPFSAQMLCDFEQLVRNKELVSALSLFGVTENPGVVNNPLICIQQFASIHADTIRDEVRSREMDGVRKWILDLTLNCLHCLLGDFSERFNEPMTVICDSSKPLAANAGFFDAMVKNTAAPLSMTMGKVTARITYNLSCPIELAESHLTPGIQCADALAGATAWALVHNGQDPLANQILGLIGERVSVGSVTPSVEHIDPEGDTFWLGTQVLIELTRRSQRGASLIEGMPEFVDYIKSQIPCIKAASR